MDTVHPSVFIYELRRRLGARRRPAVGGVRRRRALAAETGTIAAALRCTPEARR